MGRERSEASSRVVALLDGELQDISLPSLLQLAQAEAITGKLLLHGRGEIALLKGHVGAVVCGTLGGIEALRELAFHDRGRFSLVRCEPGGDRCADNITFALMDAYRLRDEWNRLAGATLRRIAERPWKPTGGLLDEVVLDLDGRRTLAEILHHRPHGLTLVLDALLDALGLGLLERVPTARTAAPVLALAPPIAAPDPAPDPADFDALVERGRALFRTRELDAAEALLRQALALRPDDRAVQQNLRLLARRRGEARPPAALTTVGDP